MSQYIMYELAQFWQPADAYNCVESRQLAVLKIDPSSNIIY